MLDCLPKNNSYTPKILYSSLIIAVIFVFFKISDLLPLADTLIIPQVCDDILLSSDNSVSIICYKKKDRKSGCKVDLMSLQPGCTGGRVERSK